MIIQLKKPEVPLAYGSNWSPCISGLSTMYAFGIHSGSPPNFGFLGPCLLRMGCGRLVKPKKPLLLRMYYYIRFCHS